MGHFSVLIPAPALLPRRPDAVSKQGHPALAPLRPQGWALGGLGAKRLPLGGIQQWFRALSCGPVASESRF